MKFYENAITNINFHDQLSNYWSGNIIINHSPFYTEMRQTLIHVCLVFFGR